MICLCKADGPSLAAPPAEATGRTARGLAGAVYQRCRIASEIGSPLVVSVRGSPVAAASPRLRFAAGVAEGPAPSGSIMAGVRKAASDQHLLDSRDSAGHQPRVRRAADAGRPRARHPTRRHREHHCRARMDVMVTVDVGQSSALTISTLTACYLCPSKRTAARTSRVYGTRRGPT